MKQSELREDFQIGGSAEGFEERLEYIEQNTEIIRVTKENIQILHFVKEYQKDGNDYLAFLVINPSSIWTDYGEFGKAITKKSRILKSAFIRKYGRELTEEFLHKSRTLIVLTGTNGHDGFYLWSDFMMTTLQCRIKLFGEKNMSPTLGRNINVAEGLGNLGKDSFQLVIRKLDNETGGKVVAVMSGIYKPIPQTIISKVAEDVRVKGGLGNMSVKQWYINHEWTDVIYNLPSKEKELREFYNFPANMHPCLYFSTSDIGENSLHAKAGWYVGHSFIACGTKSGCGEVRLRHRGHLKNSEEYLADFTDQIIKRAFPEFDAIPNAMMELAMIDATPKKLDLSKPEDILKHREFLNGLIHEVFEKANIGSAIQSKKKIKGLINALATEFDPTIKYTALDIALELMDFPSRFKSENRQTISKLENLVSGIPFLDFEELIDKVENDDKIILD